jgi:hypothetical protein
MRAMKLRNWIKLLISLALFLCAVSPLQGQSASAEGALQFGELGDLKLRNGACSAQKPDRVTLPPVQVCIRDAVHLGSPSS